MDLAVLVIIRRCSRGPDRVTPLSIQQHHHHQQQQQDKRSPVRKRRSIAKDSPMQLGVVPHFDSNSRTPPPRYKSRDNLVVDVDEKVGQSMRNV